MKSKTNILLLFIYLITVLSCSDSDTKYITPSSVPIADPYILLHDGIYYAYGTNPDNHIGVYTSKNLRSWKTAHEDLNMDAGWGEHLFWVPEGEYIKEKGKFMLYDSLDDRICAG